ncbi:MAG: protein-L-isoaspartate(D-aspartate) O-methyltransferase [Candidatus Aminicenantes bacterium]|nr:protein-L-isoaspartate(D-aspartate) O-methyltransferase [Candidatus Aminicenantes bacterium]
MKKCNFFKLTSAMIVIFSVVFFSFGEDDESYTRKREQMVRTQLKARDITDKQVLEVMGTVPRHLFVSPLLRRQAYKDSPLPIDEGQTISQPYIVALMTQHLKLKGGEKVLEIGTGSGYQAAVLAHLTDKVYSIEIRENLAKKAAEKLSALGYNQVQVKWSDGYFGWEEHAPFDAIIVTCAANHVPPPLLKQLKEGGRLIIPLGSTLYFQTLTLITKKKDKPKVKQILGVTFVPMTGEVQKRKGK